MKKKARDLAVVQKRVRTEDDRFAATVGYASQKTPGGLSILDEPNTVTLSDGAGTVLLALPKPGSPLQPLVVEALERFQRKDQNDEDITLRRPADRCRPKAS